MTLEEIRAGLPNARECQKILTRFVAQCEGAIRLADEQKFGFEDVSDYTQEALAEMQTKANDKCAATMAEFAPYVELYHQMIGGGE